MDAPVVALRAVDLRPGLLAGAAMLCLFSRGDLLVVGLLLTAALVAAEWRAAIAVLLAIAASVVRWHTTSLSSLAGAQAVFGPAAVAGPAAAVLASWAAAGALLLAAPSGWWAVPFGLAAAVVLAGPSGSTPSGLLVRLIATVALIDLTLALGRRLPAPHRRVAAVGLGAAAAVLALIGQPSGGWHWSVVSARSLAVSAAAAVALAATVTVAHMLFRR